MKRVATVLMAFVLLISSLFILVNATDDTAEGELFKNGGFEEPFSLTVPNAEQGIAQWTDEQKKQFNAGMERSDEKAHSGNYSMKIKLPSWYQSTSFRFGVKPKMRYNIEFWYFAEADFSTSSVEIKAHKNLNVNQWGNKSIEYGANLMQQKIFADNESGKWKKASFEFSSGEKSDYPSGEYVAYLRFQFNIKEQTIYLDDIKVTELGEAKDPAGILTNGGFEDDFAYYMPYIGQGIGQWNAKQISDFKGKMEVTSEKSYSGKKSMYVKAPTWSGVGGIAFGFEVKPETDYAVEFRYYAKGDFSNSTVSVQSVNNNQKCTYSKNLSGSLKYWDGTQEKWQKFSVKFNSGTAENYDAEKYIAQIEFAGVPQNTEIYFDDFRIAEISDDLILNGNFENGDSFWSCDESIWSTDKVAMGGNIESGVMHARGGENALLYQSAQLTENKNYEISFDYKGNLPAGISYWSVSAEKPTFERGSVCAFGKLEGANEVKKAHSVFKAPKSGTYYINFQSIATADYVIDNVSLKMTEKSADTFETGAEAEFVKKFTRIHTGEKSNRAFKYVPKDGANIILGGDFETDAGQWHNDAFLSGATLTSEPQAVHSGLRALKIGSDGEKTSSFYIDVEPNTEYILGVWVKGMPFDKDSNLTRMSLGAALPDTGKYIYEYYLPAYDGEWHLCEYFFKTNANTKIAFKVTADNTYVYMDDMFLCKSDESEEYKPTKSTIKDAYLITLSPELAGCDEGDNIVKDFDFEQSCEAYWEDVKGTLYGKQVKTEDSGSTVYGKSLHYNVAKTPYGNDKISAAYYIKWIDVEPETNYTMSLKCAIVKPSVNGMYTDSYFGIINANPLIPKTVAAFTISKDLYKENHMWQTFAASFNSGGYNKIGFVIYDAGGEAYFDDIRLFKTEKAKQLTDRADNFPINRLESDKYKQTDGILRVDAGTKSGDLINAFKYSRYVKLFDADGNQVTDTDMTVATGMEIRLMNGPEIKDRAVLAVPGDLDGNGRIDGADTELLLKYLSGKKTDFTVSQLSAADYDGNGSIELYDAMRKKTSPVRSDISGTSLRGPETLVTGEDFEVDFIVPSGMYGFSAEIKFDAEKLTFKDVSLGLSGSWKIESNNSEGLIKIFAADSEKKAATGADSVLTLTFTLSPNVGQNDVITVVAENIRLTDGKTDFTADSCKWSFGENRTDNNSDGKHTEYIITETQDSGKSNNNLLESLEIEGCKLTPDFTPENKKYSSSVPFEVEKVVVKAIPQDKNATVEIEDTALNYVGKNIVKVVVHSESGLKRTYKIYITRGDKEKRADAGQSDSMVPVIAIIFAVLLAGATAVIIIVIRRKKSAGKKI